MFSARLIHLNITLIIMMMIVKICAKLYVSHIEHAFAYIILFNPNKPLR